MSLVNGTSLGVYTIFIRARRRRHGWGLPAEGTKLGHDDSLKILPASFTNDPERVARKRRLGQTRGFVRASNGRAIDNVLIFDKR